MSDETWPWYALQTEHSEPVFHVVYTTYTDFQHSSRLIRLRFPARRRLFSHSSTYFSRVMTSLWPVYWRARRRARSLASELKFKGTTVTQRY